MAASERAAEREEGLAESPGEEAVSWGVGEGETHPPYSDTPGGPYGVLYNKIFYSI